MTKTIRLTKQSTLAAARAYETFCSPIEHITIAEGAVDVGAMDPPYAKRVQDNIKRGGLDRTVALGFAPVDSERRTRWARKIAHTVRRLALVFSDHEGSMAWAEALEAEGMEYIRCVPWFRTGDVELTSQQPTKSGSPQFTGDRPAAAHEIIVVARQRSIPMRWNGGGKQGFYTQRVVPPSQRIHPNQKPIELLLAILRDFCSPGETIWDAFCGAGTTLAAAKQLDLPAIGSDISKRWADHSRRRAQAARRIKEH